MAETDAIVGIYGAVDRAVQADPVARLRVAQLLPQYRDPRLHWYDDFQEWLAETAGAESPAPAFPELGDALTQLAEPPSRPRMRARWMFAIAIATRAFPEMSNPDSDLRSRAVAALRALPDAEEPEQRAQGLYKLLAGEDQPVRPDTAEAPGTSNWWNDLINTAHAERMIPDTIGMFPRPCSGRLVTVPGIDGPVAALQTELETDEIDFDTATRFIEPVNWETCMPNFWCDVHAIADPRLPAGQRRYHEEVSTHCGDTARPGFWAETELLFNFMWVPGRRDAEAAIANYELAEGRPLPNDRILVDEGTLVVAKAGDGQRPLRITTTKRVKFSYPFASEALALIMCALGYADVAGNLLACAAVHGKDVGDVGEAGTDFPGVPLTAARADAAGTPAGRPPRSGYGQGSAGGIAQEMVDIWARAVRDGVAAIEGGTRRGSTHKEPHRPGG
jgi:hypothetical protein